MRESLHLPRTPLKKSMTPSNVPSFCWTTGPPAFELWQYQLIIYFLQFFADLRIIKTCLPTHKNHVRWLLFLETIGVELPESPSWADWPFTARAQISDRCSKSSFANWPAHSRLEIVVDWVCRNIVSALNRDHSKAKRPVPAIKTVSLPSCSRRQSDGSFAGWIFSPSERWPGKCSRAGKRSF